MKCAPLVTLVLVLCAQRAVTWSTRTSQTFNFVFGLGIRSRLLLSKDRDGIQTLALGLLSRQPEHTVSAVQITRMETAFLVLVVFGAGRGRLWLRTSLVVSTVPPDCTDLWTATVMAQPARAACRVKSRTRRQLQQVASPVKHLARMYLRTVWTACCVQMGHIRMTIELGA